LALVFLVVVGMGLLSLMTARPSMMTVEANGCSSMGWVSWMLAAFALMGVPIVTWTASHVLNPPPYMVRYMFPCTSAWVLFIGFTLLAVHRLPRPGEGLRRGLPSWVATWVWIGVLAFCIFFQPVRAWKNPPRPAGAFVDVDFGHKNLPIVFENSWFYLQHAWYGHGQEYVLLIDHDAAEADPGWYTKNIERELRWFSPRYNNLRILYYKDLPDWPDGFLALDDDQTKTFEWIFSHRPELKTQLLGAQKADPPYFGEQRTYLVQRR